MTAPATPLRTQIVEAVKTALATISTTADYCLTNAGAHVIGRGKQSFDPNETGSLPAIVVTDPERVPTGNTAANYTTSRLTCHVDIYCVEADTTFAVMRDILADCERVLFADPTLGGYAIQIEDTSDSIEGDQAADTVSMARLTVPILYRHPRGQP